MTSPSRDRDDNPSQRGILWWFSAITAPIGILGGPIAIADMFAGVIEWKGWVGYFATYWGEHISHPFGVLLHAFAQRFSIPSPPEYLVDYLTLGVLFAASHIRSVMMVLSPVAENRFGMSLLAVVVAPLVVLIWPLSLLGALVFPVMAHDMGRRAQRAKTDQIRDYALRTRKAMYAHFVLLLAPFALFLVLFVLNLTL